MAFSPGGVETGSSPSSRFPCPPPPSFPIPAIVRGSPALYSRQMTSKTGSPSLDPSEESKHEEEGISPPFLPSLLPPLLFSPPAREAIGWVVGRLRLVCPLAASLPLMLMPSIFPLCCYCCCFCVCCVGTSSFYLSTGCRVRYSLLLCCCCTLYYSGPAETLLFSHNYFPKNHPPLLPGSPSFPSLPSFLCFFSVPPNSRLLLHSYIFAFVLS